MNSSDFLHTLPKTIDVEASGFGRGSYPIEIGLAMPEGHSHCFLIKPLPEWTHWSGNAERIHGISREMLFERGLTLDEVCDNMNLLLGRSTVYTDSWGHDSSWVGKLFAAAGHTQLFRLETIRAILSEEQAAVWHQAKDEVLRESSLHRHRASSDARLLQATFIRTQQKCNLLPEAKAV